MVKKGNLRRETESLLIVAQNNVIRIILIISKQKLIIRRKIASVGYEAVIQIVNEGCKLVQKKSKTWNDEMGKVIKWESCKKLGDHILKWYMHKPQSFQDDEMHILYN